MIRLLLTVITGFAMFATMVVGTVAQEAIPAASPPAALIDVEGIPDPAECTVEPRSYEELTSVMATPSARVATQAPPEATPGAPELPAGEAVDPETERAVLETLVQTIACVNARLPWHVFALYSDELVRSQLAGMAAVTEADYTQGLTATPAPESGRIQLLQVLGVVRVADGRVAALVVGDNLADERPASGTLFYFVEVEGRWLIDDVIRTPDAATPVP